MSQKQIDILQRALKREKAARKAAEKILEDKSRELYKISQEQEQLLNKKSIELKGVFENIVDAYVVVDLQGNILNFNESAIKLFGYNPNIESFNIIQLIPKEDTQYVMSAFLKLQNKGFFKNYAARVYTKSKKIKWVYINASIIFDENKKPIAAQGIVRDITESKLTRQIIKTQKLQLDAIVDNAPFGIVLTDLGQIVKTNDKFQKLIGFTAEELNKKTIKDISFIEDFPETKKFLKLVDSGKINHFAINKRYVTKDKSIIWSKTNVTAVRDNLGNIKYQVAIIEDITTEREKTVVLDLINDIAKSVLGKMDIYEIAIEIINKIAKYIGSENTVIYFVSHENNTVEQIAFNTRKQSIKKTILPIGKGIVGTVAKTGMPEIVNDTTKDKRYIVIGEGKELSKIAVPIISEDKVIGIIASEHNEKNYFTKEQFETLKSIANLVTLQLKSALNLTQLKKSQIANTSLFNKLEKSNEELQEYAHIVSHDLKSPLRSIYALVSWLKEDNQGKLDALSLQNFTHIENTLEKMEQLITDVLKYSSLGTDTPQKKEVDINILVNDIIKMLYVPDHIKINNTKTLPIIKGDKTKLQQLFQNLISNAIKFTDKEKGIIIIDVEDIGNYYKFSIEDNGIGIDEKFHDKIFKIFHVLNKNKDSTGVGLSIVKKIVSLHQGEVWLESKPNIGTTFYFTLKKT